MSLFLLQVVLMAVALTACSQTRAGTPPGKLPPSPVHLESTRSYSVRQALSLNNLGPGSPDKQNLWVALIRTVPPYQTAELRAVTPKKYQLVTDEYGNQYAEFDLSDHPAGTTIQVVLEYQVSVQAQHLDPGLCQGELLRDFIQPELHIESANPQIMALSAELSRGADNPCEQVRAFYDYVADELVYTQNRNNWGAQAALGEMGSDCTEYTDLMMALSRSTGIPARYYEGLLYLGNQDAGIAQSEHAWLDVYLPGTGWAPLDPTLGRSRLQRDTHFAQYTPDHIIVTMGRNPSTLRGSSYWSHLYWPGGSARIVLEEATWQVEGIE